jgi:hypothetical protein
MSTQFGGSGPARADALFKAAQQQEVMNQIQGQGIESQRLASLQATGAMASTVPTQVRTATPKQTQSRRNDKEVTSREGAEGARAKLGQIGNGQHERVEGVDERDSQDPSAGGRRQQFKPGDVALVSAQAPTGDSQTTGAVLPNAGPVVQGGETTQQQKQPPSEQSIKNSFAQAGYAQMQKQRTVKFYDHQYAQLWNPAPEGQKEPSLWQELKDTVSSFIPKFGKKKELPYSLGPKAESAFFPEEEKEMLTQQVQPKAILPGKGKEQSGPDKLSNGLRTLNATRANQLMAHSNHDEYIVDADPDVMAMVEDYNYLLTLPQFAGERMT